ncbi:MAG: type II toxin-antitoxin system HicB family antitoxin [Planctomycetes bacterium]|nr:type II toxin-antitoxin system HicB family antitoxin [Planctomycetota bacterium]
MNVAIAKRVRLQVLPPIVWKEYKPGVLYRCRARLLAEDDGRISVYVPELPGVASYGDTPDEAEANIAEALQAVLRSYLDAGQKIPWSSEAPPCEKDEEDRWLQVHV